MTYLRDWDCGAAGEAAKRLCDALTEQEFCEAPGTLLVDSDTFSPWGRSPGDSPPGEVLKAADPPVHTLLIHSRGGSAFDGFHFYHVVNRTKPCPNVHVCGLAYGISALLLATSGRVSIDPRGLVGFRECYSQISGDPGELRRAADLLQKLNQQIARVVARACYRRTPQAADATPDIGAVEEWMRDGQWFNANEALAAGLVDEVRSLPREEPVAAKEK